MVTDGVINKERKGKFQLIMRMITVPTTASSAGSKQNLDLYN